MDLTKIIRRIFFISPGRIPRPSGAGMKPARSERSERRGKNKSSNVAKVFALQTHLNLATLRKVLRLNVGVPRRFVVGISIALSFFILFYYSGAKAANHGSYVDFNVDKNFDVTGRESVAAVLVKTSPNIYFYVEKHWWDQQVTAKQNEILSNLDKLSAEFDNKIYPVLTSVFGSEWKPGVDGDNRITILFHSIKEGAGGYFRSVDEYIKLQAPESNEKEMIYIALWAIDSQQLKVFVAHELVHLITFNQKDRIAGLQEEVWLNEARADYASTILGYDDIYEGSNLQRRVRDFLQNPSDSLTEWQDNKYDYAVVSLFMHYLADHYSLSILADSLKLKSIGIQSLNEILLNNGANKNFGQIFTDWTIAAVINDCSVNIKYCYLNKNLKNLRINPVINFLPLNGSSSLSVANITKNWLGNWQKIIGGNGDLKLEFSSLAGLNFQIPYIIFDKDNNYSINMLVLSQGQKGQFDVPGFGVKNTALIIIPSLQTKKSGFSGLEATYPYSFTALIQGDILPLPPPLPPPPPPKNNLCKQINNNLYFGLSNTEVRCLQQFLKNQGQDIYPEGLVTGYFGKLTRTAVIRFQEKYRVEILSPIGLSRGTGFVGVFTRKKINPILNAI